jgi:hypothetical protein
VGIENASGQLSLLRVHERGSKFGPPSDQIDVEVVIQFAGQPRFYGFQLRTDGNGPAREGMLGLLRDGFNHGWVVNVDFDIAPGKNNGRIVRVWLTKPPRPRPPVLDGSVIVRARAGGKATAGTRTGARTTKRRAAAGR